MYLGLTVSFPLAILLLGYASSRQLANSHYVFIHGSINAIAAILAKHSVAIRQIQLHLGFTVSLSAIILLQGYASARHLAHGHNSFFIASGNHRIKTVDNTLGTSGLKCTPLHRLQLLEWQL